MRGANFLVSVMLVCMATGIAGCSNSKATDGKSSVDSAAIAKAQTDSIARADSIAKAKADSIAQANNITVGMSVKEALQKEGVTKERTDTITDTGKMGQVLVLKQNGTMYLTNVSYIVYGGNLSCDNLKFLVLPEAYEGDITKVKAKDCAASAKIVRKIDKLEHSIYE